MSVRKLLTCVVPCYNSAAYMERAVDSLLAGGEEMEILIVDDGSTDETGAIADRLEKEHPSVIRVRHQENRGHGSALNYGIANAEAGHVINCVAKPSHFVAALNFYVFSF